MYLNVWIRIKLKVLLLRFRLQVRARLQYTKNIQTEGNYIKGVSPSSMHQTYTNGRKFIGYLWRKNIRKWLTSDASWTFSYAIHTNSRGKGVSPSSVRQAGTNLRKLIRYFFLLWTNIRKQCTSNANLTYLFIMFMNPQLFLNRDPALRMDKGTGKPIRYRLYCERIYWKVW